MSSASSYSPPCPHFGVCGGCALQHLSPPDYGAYKQQKILQFFERQKISLDHILFNPIEIVPPQTRRRVVLKAYKENKSVHVGFYQRESHKIVDIQCCLVVVPEIEQLISPLREMLVSLLPLRSRAEIFVTKCEQGLDVALKRAHSSLLTLEQRETGAQFALTQKLARLSIDGEPLYRVASPTVSFAGFAVDITPDSFLQASLASDEWLAQKVCNAIPPETRKIADLFCGRGTLTLPLTKEGTVHGYEMDQKALEALQKTVTNYRLPVTLHHRHLFREPLTLPELALFDVIILNPPREGALAQVKHLAQAQAKRIVMVSCNLQSCARDTKVLIDRHYELKELYPLDQFLWSNHVEVVAVFDLKKYN